HHHNIRVGRIACLVLISFLSGCYSNGVDNTQADAEFVLLT
ncbi:MAG: hypothetical protein ACI934_001785, partial [Pseudohongiellaceae bacterium]